MEGTIEVLSCRICYPQKDVLKKFPFNQKFRKFQNGEKLWQNALEKLQQIWKLLNFQKANQLNFQEIVELIVKLNRTEMPSKKFAFW